MSVTDEPVNAISLIICFSSLGRLSFMNQQLVAVRIAKLRHPAHRRFSLFDIEGDTASCKFVDGGIDIFYLKSDPSPNACRFPSRMTADTDCGWAKIVLDPCAIHLGSRRF